MDAVTLLVALHGSVPALFEQISCLALVAADTQLRMALEESLEALLKQVHLGVKDFGFVQALCEVYSTVEVSQTAPKRRRSLLAELTVEDQNGTSAHVLAQLFKVAKKRLLQGCLIVDVHSTLDVPGLEFVVESAVDDNSWVLA